MPASFRIQGHPDLFSTIKQEPNKKQKQGNESSSVLYIIIIYAIYTRAVENHWKFEPNQEYN